MNFSFTEEQRLLKDSVGKYLSKNYDFEQRRVIVESASDYSESAWNFYTEMGLNCLPFPESAGGLSGSIVDSVVVALELGKYMVVEPYFSSTIVAGRAIAEGSNEQLKSSLLASLMAGKTHLAFAHEEAGGTACPTAISLRAIHSSAGYVLNGEKRLVLNARSADKIIVTARTSGSIGDKDGISLFLLDPRQEGVELVNYQTIDGKSAANITLSDVQLTEDALLTEVSQGYATLEKVLDYALVVLCAEAVGSMSQLLEITREYAMTRSQFGAPIGHFQVLRHRLADMFIAHQKVYATLLGTTALVEAGLHCPADISILKAQTGKLGRCIGEQAVQTHGGIGITDEINVGHYLKKILATDAMFGRSDYHFRKVGAWSRAQD